MPEQEQRLLEVFLSPYRKILGFVLKRPLLPRPSYSPLSITMPFYVI
jgi:hypothetical protein